MNPLFAHSIHPKLATNILDHVRTLAVILKGKFSNGGSRRAGTAHTRATGGVFFFLPRSETIAENPKKRPNYRVLSPTGAKTRTARPLPKAFSIHWSDQVSFSSKLKRIFTICIFTRCEQRHLEEDSELDADAAWRRIDNLPLSADYRFSCGRQ